MKELIEEEMGFLNEIINESRSGLLDNASLRLKCAKRLKALQKAKQKEAIESSTNWQMKAEAKKENVFCETCVNFNDKQLTCDKGCVDYSDWKEKAKKEQDGKTEQLSAEEFLKSKVIEWKTSMSYYYSFSGHELADLLEEYSKQNNEDFQLQRLYDWLMNENREPAKTKFTAGTLRNVANEIEFRLKQ